MTRDVRYAWRSLTRNPVFAFTAVLSVAIGIGANTALFTLADQILLRSLPVKEPHRLVVFEWTGQFMGGSMRGGRQSFSYPAYRDIRSGAAAAFTGIAARYQTTGDISDRGTAERSTLELVSGNYFDVIGAAAVLGRSINAADDERAAPVAVLSHDYWQTRFGADPSILNRVLTINSELVTVVGVIQRGFRGFDPLSPSDIFLPVALKRAVTPSWDDMARRNSTWLTIFARLAPGVDSASASNTAQVLYSRAVENDLATLSRSEDFRQRYRNNRITLRDASSGFTRSRDGFATAMQIMIAITGVFLLIACVNVAGLLVTRSAARNAEIAIRLSLGASRWSIGKLVMTESLMIAVFGGALGLLLSWWMAAFLVGMLPESPLTAVLDTTADRRILAFNAGTTLLAALAFGLLPAVQAARPGTAAILRAGSWNMSSGRAHLGLRRMLVAGQVTASVVLLVCAGWFSRSLYNLLASEIGVRSERLLTFAVDPSLHGYVPAGTHALYNAVRQEVGHTAGISSVSGASFPVMANVGWENTVSIDGRRSSEGENMQAGWNQVLPGFFSTLGVPLLSGREFNDRDGLGAPKVVIVNETFVRRFFGNEVPLGRRIGFGSGSAAELEIVGVVKDFKSGTLRDVARPWTYTPALQNASPAAMTFYVATHGDPASAASAVRQAVAKVNTSMPVYDMKSIEAQIAETHFSERVFATLSLVFGTFATLLAAVGVFGVTAFAVTRRMREFGIRIAVGARPDDIVRMVLQEMAVIVAAGAVTGLLIAIAPGRLVEAQLSGVRSNDVLVAAAAVCTITVAALIAAAVSCRRAARVNVVSALRYE